MSDVLQGDVYWIDLAEPHGSAPAFRRPCVVVQSDGFNRSRIATTVVCIITSNLDLARAPGNVALGLNEAGLTRASVVNVSQILTVNKFDLEDKIGRLSRASLKAVLSGLRLLFEP